MNQDKGGALKQFESPVWFDAMKESHWSTAECMNIAQLENQNLCIQA